MSDQEKIKDFRLEVEALKFAILGIYSELEKRNIDAKEFITTSSKSADLQKLHHKFDEKAKAQAEEYLNELLKLHQEF